jgi:hypothetical protein
MNRTRIVAAILFMSGVTLAALLQEWPNTPLPLAYWIPGHLGALLLAGEGVYLWNRKEPLPTRNYPDLSVVRPDKPRSWR